jgi:hypothetical protein
MNTITTQNHTLTCALIKIALAISKPKYSAHVTHSKLYTGSLKTNALVSVFIFHGIIYLKQAILYLLM